MHSLRQDVVLGLAMVLWAQGAAMGQTARLVKDLGQLEVVGSGPVFFVSELEEYTFFLPRDSAAGRELWATNGTAEGTRMLLDACPGPCDAFASFSQPWIFATLDGHGIFRANGFEGRFLFATDGTVEGTEVLTGAETVVPGSSFAVLDDLLIFSGVAEDSTPELWSTDGTPAGTQRVAQFASGGQEEEPDWLVRVGETILFFVGTDLWRTDGSPQGTVLVTSLAVTEVSVVSHLGDRLVFLTRDAEGKVTAWASDGTELGTRAFRAVPHGLASLEIYRLGEFAFFVTAEEPFFGPFTVWQSDGTPAGTSVLAEIPRSSAPLSQAGGHLFRVDADSEGGRSLQSIDLRTGHLEELLECGSTLPCRSIGVGISPFYRLAVGETQVFFEVHINQSDEIWRSDGTAAGTFALFTEASAQAFDPSIAAVDGDRVVFAALDSQLRQQLWSAEAGPASVRRLTAFKMSVSIGLAAPRGDGSIVFDAWNSTLGDELWRAGSSLDPVRLTSLEAPEEGTRPGSFAELGDEVFFLAFGLEDFFLVLKPFLTDGAHSGTRELVGLFPAGQPSSLARPAPVGDVLVIEQGDFNSVKLWRTDGTVNGTFQLPTPLSSPSQVVPQVSYQGLLFRGHDKELWKTDGELTGTQLVWTAPTSGQIAKIAAIGDWLYLEVGELSTSGGTRLWRSDGTEEGAELLTGPEVDLQTAVHGRFEVAAAGDLVFFAASDPTAGKELWRTDGTAAGTQRVADLLPGDESSNPRGLTGLNGHLLFIADAASGGVQLWRTDGTAAGTQPLRSLVADYLFFRPRVLDNRLYFVADDGEHGIELWSTDGTAAGTALLKDINPGPALSFPSEMVETPLGLVFDATTRSYGRELWVTDGTEAGTRLLQDINPGIAGSNPEELTVIGDRLYFGAQDGWRGLELWSLDLSQSPGCQPSERHLCLNNARFQVEVGWRDFQNRIGEGTGVPLTQDTGYFWFFNDANVETVLKVLDGRPLNGHFWTFFGALSNVEYALTLTDTQTGLTRRYYNPPRRFASVGDTRSFDQRGPKEAVTETIGTAGEPMLVDRYFDPSALKMTCAAGPIQLCLNGGRFGVTAEWEDFQGNTGVGTAVPLTTDTGYFWFFRDTNVEVVLKVLDGRPLNGNFWVFYGALSNVAYRLTVTDTETGEVKVYENPARRFASVGDTAAFGGE